MDITAHNSLQQDFLARLGKVLGVSELEFNAEAVKFTAPVLVAENALLFLPWQYDSFSPILTTI